MMRNSPLLLTIASLAVLILISGCEKNYEPAAYKAAPRVDAEQLASESAAKGKLPNITNWTSPSAVRGSTLGGISRAYSGLRGYRGIDGRRYAGMNQPYRGYAGQSRSYRGIGGTSGQYRGNAQQRSYRGRN